MIIRVRVDVGVRKYLLTVIGVGVRKMPILTSLTNQVNEESFDLVITFDHIVETKMLKTNINTT